MLANDTVTFQGSLFHYVRYSRKILFPVTYENKENLKYFFRDTIKHLDGKRWYCEEIHNDLLNLMDFIYNDIDSFSNILKQYPEEVIKEKYQNSVSDFFK